MRMPVYTHLPWRCRPRVAWWRCSQEILGALALALLLLACSMMPMPSAEPLEEVEYPRVIEFDWTTVADIGPLEWPKGEQK